MQGYDSDDEQSISHRKDDLNDVQNKIEKSVNSSSILELPDLDQASSSIRRRNVNWDLSDSNHIDPQPLRIRRGFQHQLETRSDQIKEDDGFESLTGKSSSGDDTKRNNLQVQTDSDTETLRNNTPVKMKKNGLEKKHKETTDSDDDSLTPTSSNHHFETTDGEYIGVTSNSESECDDDDTTYHTDDDDNVPTKILNPNDSSEKVTVTLWSKHVAKKAELSVLDISSAIVQRVNSIPETYDYVYIAMVMSVVVSLTPIYCRLCDVTKDSNSTSTIFDLPRVIDDTFVFSSFVQLAFGQTYWEKALLLIATLQRLVLAFCFFFLLAVAERTFKQR